MCCGNSRRKPVTEKRILRARNYPGPSFLKRALLGVEEEVVKFITPLVLVLALGQLLWCQKNVILLVPDQLRADRLHAYGNPRETSPNMDRLAAEGVLLKNYYSNSSWTTPSEGTMHTSLPASVHAETLFWTRPGPPAFEPQTETLASAFKKAGYRTAVFSSNPQAGRFLIGRGVDHFDQRNGLDANDASWKAPDTNRRILSWLDQNAGKPFFLFVNYWEPHSPYIPTPEHDIFGDGGEYGDVKAVSWPQTATRRELDMQRRANLGDTKAVDRTVQLYDGYVHEFDAYLGELIAALKARGLDKDTVIMITSDHGELLYSHPDDHMSFDHRSLYDANIQVPAIFWGPGIPQGAVRTGIASHLDLAPTLLDLAGVEGMTQARGRSLVPMLRGSVEQMNEFVFAEQDLLEKTRSVRDSRFKLIENLDTGAIQLFDTTRDPGEHIDISKSQPAVVRQLCERLKRWRIENENQARAAAREQTIARVVWPNYAVDDLDMGARFQLDGFGWQSRREPDAFRGYINWSEPASDDEPVRKAVWRADNPLRGKYRVSVFYAAKSLDKIAPDAQFRIVTRTGETVVTIDQRTMQGTWVELGLFDDPLRVVLTNQASGRVIADCVQFNLLNQ